MLAVKGICENGKIELLEPIPKDVQALGIDVPDIESEIAEANILAQLPVFQRLIQHGLDQIEQGHTRPAAEFLNELPD